MKGAARRRPVRRVHRVARGRPGPSAPVRLEPATPAEARLAAALGDLAGAPLPACLGGLVRFVREERGRIEAGHREGWGGRRVVAEQADVVDVVVRQLFRLADAGARPEAAERSRGLALLALGGYGRRELNPASDVDIMFVYAHRVDAYVDAVLHTMVPLLWDLGFVLGHSCRSISDCVRLAESDLTIRTSMLEARFLAGRREVFEAFRERMARSLEGERVARYIAEKLAEREDRYRRHGRSLYLQEPNVKEGAGGLRDLHTALWVARAQYRVEGLDGLRERGLLTADEYAECAEAWDFLLRVRNALHYLCQGKMDVLMLPIQAQVATHLQVGPDGELSGVERFMQHYYIRVRRIHLLSRRVVDRCAQGRSPVTGVMKRPMVRDLGDGFCERSRQVHIAAQNGEILREDPVRILKAFWFAHQTGYPLSVEAKDLLRAHLDLVDEEFRRSNRALGFFLAILREPLGVARILRGMHEVGVLGAYIPEFAKLMCLVQYDFYHKYTVDEHTFIALDTLEALYASEGDRQDEFRAIARELKRPEILKLGVLLHDIGKGEGHGHVARGAAMVGPILSRMGLPEADIEAVRFLVAHHLTMAHIAERRDLDDEPLLIEFAKQVREVNLLKKLYLLTYLDIKAVGPQVWTEWKGTLLLELYLKTMTILTRGIPEGTEDLVKAAAIRARLGEELGAEIPPAVIQEHLDNLPVRYTLTTSGGKVGAHLRLVQRVLAGAEVAATWADYPMSGYSELMVCAYGRPGRFAQIVGTLTANGLNILGAQVFTRKDNMMIRSFQVDDGRGGAIADRQIWVSVDRDLQQILRGGVDVRDLIRARRREVLMRPAGRGHGLPTRVEFDNYVSERYTVIDVRTQDRPGLLYTISAVLNRLGLDLGLAKIATEVDQVIDVFYVTEQDGAKVQEGSRMEEIRTALEEAISEGLL